MTDESADMIDALAQLSFVVQGALAARAAESGASMPQVRLLGILRDRTPTMNALARLLELDKSSVTGLVARAQERGLVTRSPSALDGRSTVVALTPLGRRLIDAVAAGFSADLTELLDELSAGQRRTLQTLATRLIAGHARRRGIDTSVGGL